MKILAENKKAYFKYQILEKFEAGISLIGQEVKSIKNKKLLPLATLLENNFIY